MSKPWAAYVRVSSDKQEDKRQRKAIRVVRDGGVADQGQIGDVHEERQVLEGSRRVGPERAVVLAGRDVDLDRSVAALRANAARPVEGYSTPAGSSSQGEVRRPAALA